MLSSIIKDGQSIAELEEQLREENSPKYPREKEHAAVKLKHNSVSDDRIDMTKKYNYVHYDPELHWCRTCDVFPKTAKDFLLHLQSEEHKKVAHERDMKDDTPWHHLPAEPELPYYEGAPKKRLPIKGKPLSANRVCFRSSTEQNTDFNSIKLLFVFVIVNFVSVVINKLKQNI